MLFKVFQVYKTVEVISSLLKYFEAFQSRLQGFLILKLTCFYLRIIINVQAFTRDKDWLRLWDDFLLFTLFAKLLWITDAKLKYL